jgi:hypothetical protein
MTDLPMIRPDRLAGIAAPGKQAFERTGIQPSNPARRAVSSPGAGVATSDDGLKTDSSSGFGFVMLVVVVLILVHRFLEILHAFAQPLRHLREAAAAKKKHQDDENDDQFLCAKTK